MDVYIGHNIEDGQVYSLWTRDLTMYKHHMKYLDVNDELLELKANLFAILMVMSFDNRGETKVIHTNSVKAINCIREGSTYSDPYVFSMRSIIKALYRKNYEDKKSKLKFRFCTKEKSVVWRKIKT